jgi:hypothetical protein
LNTNHSNAHNHNIDKASSDWQEPETMERHAQVTKDGTYIPAKNTKHSYGSMIKVRALMAEVTGWDLVKPVAVAFHYTKFRKQFRKSGVTVRWWPPRHSYRGVGLELPLHRS